MKQLWPLLFCVVISCNNDKSSVQQQPGQQSMIKVENPAGTMTDSLNTVFIVRGKNSFYMVLEAKKTPFKDNDAFREFLANHLEKFDNKNIIIKTTNQTKQEAIAEILEILQDPAINLIDFSVVTGVE
jgi:hypothetical protein